MPGKYIENYAKTGLPGGIRRLTQI